MKTTKNQIGGQSVKDPRKRKHTPPCIGVNKSSTKLTGKIKKPAGWLFYHFIQVVVCDVLIWYSLLFIRSTIVYDCIAVLIPYPS